MVTLSHGKRIVLGRLLPKEKSVSYIVLVVLSVAFVRLAVVCVYPRQTIAGDDLDANTLE